MAADPRFYPQAGPQPLEKVLAAAGASPLQGEAAGRLFAGIAPLESAGPEHVAYLDNAKLASRLGATSAGAVILRQDMAGHLPEGCQPIVVKAPSLAFAQVARLFHPARVAQAGRHPTAIIAEDAVVASDAEIGAYAMVGGGARIGAGCILHPHAVVGAGVILGDECEIHSHASISHAVCGKGVVLHPGARVGQEGFGFVPTPDGRFVTMPQLGRVILEDAVQVGANSCIDRGALEDTVVGAGTRIDNLVQLGHNVRTGRGCVLVSQVGVSGSTTLGNYVTLAGQAGLVGHIHVGDGARVGAQAGIVNDVPAGAEVWGTPSQPVRQHLKEIATLRRMAAEYTRKKRDQG
ncbi:UDP-3-O-(3-hydroxymyristoyl)glucosamine N-acyltransferase [Rhodovarius crocodyli]|uniref:UDP-3-O-acylglucosamine N-acyltransferase n=1 Tax=Rhodovarius crocodyli TaxID=1979269 RepID=A0A437MJK3_9PROT|nr:UDP-3-O-(3-hydroxymyristoyl)glucosamine N-acyltransferase [Rhodovarius crocodyli]RVT97830.1 UDP-3-O-(3-hydroxymyristoyl)glucosamine N-acyltransferase [Rhodovarius crocodyli]